MKLRGKSIGSPRNTQGRPLGLPTRTILVAGTGSSSAVLTESVFEEGLT